MATAVEARAPSAWEDGLLCALVLVPTSFSRNRCFQLYQRAELARVRRRAARIASAVAQLSVLPGEAPPAVRETLLARGERGLSYSLPASGLLRHLTLGPLEHAALEVALARARDAEPPASARARVEEALLQLWRPPPAPPRDATGP